MEHVVVLRCRTFAPISWIYKKQTAVSHSSTEAEMISLDAGVRLKGIPALTLWDMVTDVLEPEAGRNPLRNTKPKKTKPLLVDQRSTDSIDYEDPKRTCLQPTNVFV